MLPTRTASAVVSIVLCFVANTIAFGQSDANQQAAGTLAFPNQESDEHWKVRSFWPMSKTYGWDIPHVPVGSYRLVVRYGPAKQCKSPLSAKDATKEYTSEKPFVIDRDQFRGKCRGYVSFQLVDLSDIGVEAERPVRVRVVLSLKGRNGSVRIPLSAPVLGRSGSQSPVSNLSWNNDELHFVGFTSKHAKTGLAIRYDAFVVRSPPSSQDKATRSNEDIRSSSPIEQSSEVQTRSSTDSKQN